jgi:hypothetical protein
LYNDAEQAWTELLADHLEALSKTYNIGTGIALTGINDSEEARGKGKTTVTYSAQGSLPGSSVETQLPKIFN